MDNRWNHLNIWNYQFLQSDCDQKSCLTIFSGRADIVQKIHYKV